MKNILHISDFHVSNRADKGLQQHRLKQLLKYILDDIKGISDIDTILITGDISYSGKPEEYKTFNQTFLSPLLEELGVDSSRVIVTPGNHDSDRSGWKATEKSSRKSLISKIDQNDIESVLKEINLEEGGVKRLKGYCEFRNDLDKHPDKKRVLNNHIYSVYDVDGVGVGCLNTAWLSADEDFGRLIIGRYQLQEVINKLKEFDQRILMFHHPADWLNPEDKKMAYDLIHQSKIQCLFFGHMHELNVSKESQFDENSILKLQAGKLDISKSDTYGGYTVLRLIENNKFENGHIYFRKFDHSTSKFVPWLNRLNGGEHVYTLDRSVVFNANAFAKICQDKIQQIEYDLICNTGLEGEKRRRLSDIFIFPALAFDDDRLAKEGMVSDRKEGLGLSSLIMEEKSCVILGAENSGKSTLGKMLALQYLNRLSNENLETFVFYLDLKGANLNSVNQVKNQLLSFYTEIEGAEIFLQRIEKKLSSKDAVIIFDSIEVIDKNTQKVFEKVVTKYSCAKYFLLGKNTAKSEVKSMLSDLSENEKSLAFTYYNIKNIKRSQVRALFDKWTVDSDGSKEKFVKHALKVVDSAGMPNNPFVYTMLLSINDRKASIQRSYMHEADVVENFIETILEKHVTLNSDKSPQYKDLLLFLGSIAKEMQKSGSYIIRYDDLWESAIKFNRAIYQKFKIENYIEPIINSGILEENKDGYIFAQTCFFNYVFANWLNHPENQKSYDDLDLELDFIYFDKVVEYLAALRKSDIALLEYIDLKTEIAWDDLKSSSGIENLRDAETEIAKNVGYDLIDLIDNQVLERVPDGNYPSAKDLDDEMDEVSPLTENAVKEIQASKTNLKPSVYFFQTLSLYSRAFRAAEHILNKETTAKYFNKIVNYYMDALAYLVRDFEMNGRSQFLKVLKDELKVENLDSTAREQAVKQMSAFMNFVVSFFPEYIVSLMTSELFNQRQLVKIKEFREVENNNLTKIILTYCLCELDGVNVVNELKGQDYKKPHESTSLFIKMIVLTWMDLSISDEDKIELERYVMQVIKRRKGMQEIVNFSTMATKLGAIEKSTEQK